MEASVLGQHTEHLKSLHLKANLFSDILLQEMESGTATANRRCLQHKRTDTNGHPNQNRHHQLHSPNTLENSSLSIERLLGSQLAYIGDLTELRGLSRRAGNAPRTIGRSLAMAGDELYFKFSSFAQRKEMFLRLLWGRFAEMEDGSLVFAGALLQLCYLLFLARRD